MRPTERHELSATRWAHSLHRLVSHPVENLNKRGSKISEDIVLTQTRPCARLSHVAKSYNRPSGTRKLEREQNMKTNFSYTLHFVNSAHRRARASHFRAALERYCGAQGFEVLNEASLWKGFKPSRNAIIFSTEASFEKVLECVSCHSYLTEVTVGVFPVHAQNSAEACVPHIQRSIKL